MLVDYHLHIERGPYTLEWLQEFIHRGQSVGIAEFGFSEHCYRFTQAKHLLENPWAGARCSQDIFEYVNLINQAKQAGLPVKLGLEVDYIPGKEAEIREFLSSLPLDYAIGSIHWLQDWGFDLAETLPRWEKADVDSVYEAYFHTVQQAARSKLFDFLGHLDLVKIFGYRPTRDMYPVYLETVKTIADSGCAVEVSTAGLRKHVGEIYPLPSLLTLCRQHDIPITLSSDAHEPQAVGENFPQAVELAKSCGYTSILRFTNRKPIAADI
ncbi:MAG TPA: histidinol-phosphatase HisJ family protein [Verrucomicrobiae bacterium]|nr:histidinol-phosphatase HisJ family protein [Verrucomicrobiae bacterium]